MHENCFYSLVLTNLDLDLFIFYFLFRLFVISFPVALSPCVEKSSHFFPLCTPPLKISPRDGIYMCAMCIVTLLVHVPGGRGRSSAFSWAGGGSRRLSLLSHWPKLRRVMACMRYSYINVLRPTLFVSGYCGRLSAVPEGGNESRRVCPYLIDTSFAA